MAESKRGELYKQRQLIEEQLEKCKEEREHARKRREREKQARKLREEAFDMKLQWTMDRQQRRKSKQSDLFGAGSQSNNDDDSSDDNPTVSSWSMPSQKSLDVILPTLSQQPRNSRRSKRLTIGEETGQKEQRISDGSDFVSGYSDDSDNTSQGETGLVAEVQSLRQQLTAVNTERNQLITASEGLPTVTLDGRQLASSLPRHRQPFPRSLSTQSTKSEAIQNLFVEIDRLGQESNHLKQQLHCKAVECADLLQLLEEKESLLLAVQVENKELQSDLLRLENESYSLSRDQAISSGNYSNCSSVWHKKMINEVEVKLSDVQKQLDQIIKEKNHLVKERDQLIKEKGLVAGQRDQLIKEQDQVAEERDQITKERDHVIAERDHVIRTKNFVVSQLDQVTDERDHMIKERDQVIRERDHVIKEMDQLLKEKQQVIIERDQVMTEKDRVNREQNLLIKGRDQLVVEKDQVMIERDEVIKEMDEITREKDELIKQRYYAVTERDQVVIERDQVIKGMDEVTREKDELIKQRDYAIKERDQVVIERDQVIKGMDEMTREKDELIKQRDYAIKESDQVSRKWDFTVKEKDSVISQMDRVIKERDQIARERGHVIKERDRVIKESVQLTREKDKAIETLHGTLSSLQQRLDDMMEENSLMEGKLQAADEFNKTLSDQLAAASEKIDQESSQNRTKLDLVMQQKDHVIQQRDYVMKQLSYISSNGLSQVHNDMTFIQNLLLNYQGIVLSEVTRVCQEVISHCKEKVDGTIKDYSSEKVKLICLHQQELCKLNQLIETMSAELQQARREDFLQMERAELNNFEATLWMKQCRRQSEQLARRQEVIREHKRQLLSCQTAAVLEVEKLNETLTIVKEQLGLVNEELGSRGDKLKLAQHELESKEQMLVLANKELASNGQLLEKASKELVDARQMSSKQGEEILEVKKRLFCSEHDKCLLKSELSSLRTSRGSNVKLLEAQLEHLINERDSLRLQLTSLRDSQVVTVVSPCDNHGNSEALQEKIVQLQGRVEARDEVLEELQREMKEKELANFSVVAKLKSTSFELTGQLEAAKASLVAKETRLREVEDHLSVAEQQLEVASLSTTASPTETATSNNELLRLRSLVSELTFKLNQSQHRCGNQPVTSQLPSVHDETFTTRRPKYTLLPRQPATSWPRNSLLRSQFSINLPGQSDQSIDLLDNSSGDQYRLGPVVVTDDHVHGQLEHVRQRYRTHRRVQSCDSSLSTCFPPPNSSSTQSVAVDISQCDGTSKIRPKSAESSHHQPIVSPLSVAESCDLPGTPLTLVTTEGSVTPIVDTTATVSAELPAALPSVSTTTTTTTTSTTEQRKFKLLKRFIGFKAAGESKGKRSLGPVITIAMPTTATVNSDKEWALKRSESITSNETSFTTGSISPSLDGCENFSKIERHESFASYGGGLSRTSSIVSRDFLVATPKVSSCFKPIMPDEESSSEEDWDKPRPLSSKHNLITWSQQNQSMIDMATAAMATDGIVYGDHNKSSGMQFSIRLLPQQRSYSSDTINLDTMEASESEEEHERLRNVNELVRRKGRLHCRYSSTGSLVKIYCASDTSMEDIRSLQQ